MKVSSTVPKPKLSEDTQRQLDELARLSEEAVRRAREENRRLGIPNVQVDGQGHLTEELPDGTVRPVRSR
jgi:hypothetical protein